MMFHHGVFLFPLAPPKFFSKTSFSPLTNRGHRGYNSQAFDFEELICECAGIGRQASLRCLCSTGRVGSSPITRTIPQNESNRRARVVELADSLDSGSSAHYGRAGSSPASRTNEKVLKPKGFRTFSFFALKMETVKNGRFSNSSSNRLQGSIRTTSCCKGCWSGFACVLFQGDRKY